MLSNVQGITDRPVLWIYSEIQILFCGDKELLTLSEQRLAKYHVFTINLEKLCRIA